MTGNTKNGPDSDNMADNPATGTSKGGRPKVSRTRGKPDALSLIRVDALMTLHGIATDSKQSAGDRIAAARLLLTPFMDSRTGGLA